MIETKQVIFQLDGEEYGISIIQVSAIEKYTNVVRIPNAPKCIKGIINLRGEVIPIYALREKFNLPPKQGNSTTQLIIVKYEDMQIAFEVDVMGGIVDIENESITKVPSIVRSKETSYLGGIARVGDRLILLLDLDGIVTKEEQAQIATLMKEEDEKVV